jgi:hypothetical protein
MQLISDFCVTRHGEELVDGHEEYLLFAIEIEPSVLAFVASSLTPWSLI